MKHEKKISTIDSLQVRLTELEERAAKREIHVHYDMLEAAGLKLKDGICKINGEYHIFIEKRNRSVEAISDELIEIVKIGI